MLMNFYFIEREFDLGFLLLADDMMESSMLLSADDSSAVFTYVYGAEILGLVNVDLRCLNFVFVCFS